MDGLTSLAHDPIMLLHHEDKNLDYEGSVDGQGDQPSRSSMSNVINNETERQEANDLLQDVFGEDAYLSDRKFSLGSQADNSMNGEMGNDFGGRIHDTIAEEPISRNVPPMQQQQSRHQEEQELLHSLQQSITSERPQNGGNYENKGMMVDSFQMNMSHHHPNGDSRTNAYPQYQGSSANFQQQLQPQNIQFNAEGQPNSYRESAFPMQNFSHGNVQQVQEFQMPSRREPQDHSMPPFQLQQPNNLPLPQPFGGDSHSQDEHPFPQNTASMPQVSSRDSPTTMANHRDMSNHSFQNGAEPSQVSSNSHMALSPASGNGIIDLLEDDGGGAFNPSKKARLDISTTTRFASPASESNVARSQNMPSWMQNVQDESHTTTARPSEMMIRSNDPTTGYRQSSSTSSNSISSSSYNRSMTSVSRAIQHPPRILEISPDFIPTWEAPLPRHLYRRPQGRRRYELSLVNVKEFTITGLPVSWEVAPSSLDGLRKKIKELSKEHGKATFERNKDGTDGRWRIPLGAYNAFFSYLNSDPLVQVVGIPQEQLKIASLGKARLDKGYPSTRKLISLGVPRGLATALAPFQRGGVDFVVEKWGRALIADDMGLGKTVQGIAGMSVFHRDWPILVLTPSSARYHWENEFQHWLGRDSPVNRGQQVRVNLGGESDGEDNDSEEGDVDESNCMPLLEDSQIHVLTSGKDAVIPNSSTKVVICSYGLAPALAASGIIYPGLFRAAIVDESHMLKNINTKRTKNLVPILHATNRCVLLSGTPALAKPTELWPQLKILSTEKTGWWDGENEFIEKYVKNSSSIRRAELHAMLTATVMIRRLKHDILKSLPMKSRSKAVVDVSTPDMRSEFHRCMIVLREGKGQLGKLARQHSALGPVLGRASGRPTESELSSSHAQYVQGKEAIKKEYNDKLTERMRGIQFSLPSPQSTLSTQEMEHLRSQMEQNVMRELKVWYDERIHELEQEISMQPENDEISKKSVLNRMYSLTGKAKLPLIASMIQKWLSDPTKGKLCVFAHHIFILDELARMAGLSNSAESTTQYIRIDGSTSPKERQAQIKKFQTDPNVRIAILGITAAGVAVTLTASSTVWFAELFWTPALMIQAEDRCHRIGQNSRVNCLYFVATGTLDELLWKLLEKKFRDLGEFVEGMEKQKIVVHKTYHGTKELDVMFELPDDAGSDDEAELANESDDEEGKDILKLHHDLEGDIAQLVKEEMTMMKTEGDEEDGVDESVLYETKQCEPVAGSTEDEAIMLSDDEGDEGMKSSGIIDMQKLEKAGVERKQSEGNAATQDRFDRKSNKRGEAQSLLEGCRGYAVMFEGNSFGMQLFIFRGRAIVGRKILNQSYERPAVGDALVAVNGQRLPMANRINEITNFMKASMQRGPVELIFIEHPILKQIAVRQREHEEKVLADERRQADVMAKMAKPIAKGPDDVIDLLDDD